MARWFKCFKTKEEQDEWEQEHSDIKVCMRMTAKELEKDLHLPDGQFDKYKYATIYRYVD